MTPFMDEEITFEPLDEMPDNTAVAILWIIVFAIPGLCVSGCCVAWIIEQWLKVNG